MYVCSKLKMLEKNIINHRPLRGIWACCLLWIAVSAWGCGSEPALPILGPKYPPIGAETDSTWHAIGDFSFVNQDGKMVNRADYAGKIWVADVFFTACPGICPKLTEGFTKVQEAFRNDPDIMLLSITVDPEKDSIPVLADYASQHGAISGKWNMVTGNKKDLYEFANKQFFFKAFEGEDGELGFVHDQDYRLLDKEGRMRGIWHYDGTNPEMVDSLIADIKRLKSEYNQGK